jgi:hypothetical protein
MHTMATEDPITIDDELVEELRTDFRHGPIINDQGQRFLIEEEIDRFKGLVIHIFGLDHPPPHFCVRYQGESANFNIETGDRLPNNRGLETYERNIRKWWKKNREKLIDRWNATRPTDCPVGPIANTGSPA